MVVAGSRSARAVVLAVAAVLGLAASRPADAQHVLLQLRPHVGDTLHIRVDQEVDIAGRTARPTGDSITSVTTTLFALARMIVAESDTGGSDLVVVVDSTAQSTIGGHPARAADRAPSDVIGQPVHVRMAPDGVPEIADAGGSAGADLQGLLAGVPATLPRQPVTVGQAWERTMAAAPVGASPSRGTITLRFRLDSVSRRGDSAYVSVRGDLGRGRFGPSASGATVTTWGTVVGTMLIDRRRGWMTDFHAVISVHSVLTPSAGVEGTPGRLRMTITEWFRTVDRA
jgi:hypothetical protein